MEMEMDLLRNTLFGVIIAQLWVPEAQFDRRFRFKF